MYLDGKEDVRSDPRVRSAWRMCYAMLQDSGKKACIVEDTAVISW
jgi:hypothetical protein